MSSRLPPNEGSSAGGARTPPPVPPSGGLETPPPLPPSNSPFAATISVATAPTIAAAADVRHAGESQGEHAATPEDFDDDFSWQDWMQQLPSWMASMTFHLTVFLFLALITTSFGQRRPLEDLREMGISAHGDGARGDGNEMLQRYQDLNEMMSQIDALPQMQDTTLDQQLAADPLQAADDGAMTTMLPEAGVSGGPTMLAGTGSALANLEGAGKGFADDLGDSLLLRMNGPEKAEITRNSGGTDESEKAVALSLKWIAAHQEYDGGWSFDHQKSPNCKRACNNPGMNPSRNAATAMALAPFLGAGYTHKEGQYKSVIDRGLKFLIKSMPADGTGSFWEPGGTMYAHGMCSLVLCEAYGMTKDRALQDPAQKSLNYIVYAQDPRGGGWRYTPQMPGDTSVVGWQVMAMRSGQLAYLVVPADTFRQVSYFLDSTQGDRGATYKYLPYDRVSKSSTTSIGLLSRMYLGWSRETPALQRGVKSLSTIGPSTEKSGIKNDMYYNYYATQVMHHYGGSEWRKWNDVMRDYLVKSQSKKGHEAGSWFFVGDDKGERAGGRLYFTALSAMTLEVYYRYMPVYKADSVKK